MLRGSRSSRAKRRSAGHGLTLSARTIGPEERRSRATLGKAPQGISSSRHQVANEGEGARVFALSEPEERLMTHVAALIMLGDVDQLVERFAVAALGENEGVMAAQSRLVDLVVQLNEIGGRRPALAEPLQRLLTSMFAFLTL